MCRAANTPSTTAQQKAATTPKLMNTMAATSWKQRWERLGRGRTFQRPPRSGPESLQSPVAPPRGPRLEPHGTSPGSSPGTPRHLPWVLARSPTGLSPRTLRQLCGVLTSHHGCWRPTTLAGVPHLSKAYPATCLFHGAQGCRYTGAVAPPHSLVDESGPPRARPFLTIANSAPKTLIALHRKAWAQTQAFLQDGGHRCQGTQRHLCMPEPRERVGPPPHSLTRAPDVPKDAAHFRHVPPPT